MKRIFSKLIFWTVVLGSFSVAIGFIFLVHQIRTEFKENLWDIPVHIYSNSVELYSGLQVSPVHLERRLQSLGYRQSEVVQNPGEYRLQGNSLYLVTREFTFWDGFQESKAVHLTMNDHEITSLTDVRMKQRIHSLRLRPQLIGSLSQQVHEDRELVRLQEIPKLLLTTLVAVEDRNFPNHHGVDIRAIMRAAWVNFKADRIVQGGSTLTQQLVKNVFERDERTYQRKLMEIATAFVLEILLEKHQILQAYCNEVFLGQDGKRAIHGFGLSSHYFFGRPVSELRASEIALLVGMVKAPSSYNPLRHPERALKRRNVVLAVMRDENLLNEQEYVQAIRSSLGVVSAENRTKRNYASYIDVVLRQLSKHLSDQDISTGNFSVYTHMDTEVQRAAEQSLSSELKKLENRKNLKSGSLQGAVVVVQPDTGQILAIVGGRSGHIGMFNRALDAYRPIGSLMKPLVYLSALERDKAWTLATHLQDEPFSVTTKKESWQPKNFDRDYLGEITILEALAQSRNIPTVRLGMDLGLVRVTQLLRKFGIEVSQPVYPSLLLGTTELSPLAVSQIYQILANSGYKVGLRTVATIGRNTATAERPASFQAEAVLPSEYVQLVLFAMQEVVANGTARALSSTFEPKLKLAGKTGTTNDFRDSWFVGMSGNLLAVVWLGYDDNRSTGLTGASGALKVWASLMNKLDLRPLSIDSSSQLEFHMIDLDSGLIAGNACKNVKRMPFIRGSAPKQTASCGFS